MAEEFDLRVVSVDKIEPNEWNPNKQDPEEFARLVHEIKNVGFIDPVTVVEIDEDRFRLLGGEHRWRAAQKAGLQAIPAQILPPENWEEDAQKFVTVRMNVLKGDLDAEKFIALHDEMAEKYGEEAMQNLFAFTDKKAFKKALGQIGKGVRDTLPDEAKDRFDEKAADAESVDDLEDIVRDLFNRYGDTVEHNFLVFKYGDKEHIYIQMDKPCQQAMHRIVDYCRYAGEDINKFITPILAEAGNKAIEARKQADPAEHSDTEDDVDF